MTDIEALPLPRVFAALIASALYMATYLSFVRLLRYPRNWYPPSLRASLTTGVLAALTVALVSLSPNGLDRAALAVSVGFIVVLFYIIAAPAIAFWPASGLANRAVEFLAKHCNYAGLWLLGPAFFAGLAISNIKLQAFLATAMAIELTWFLRQLWVGRQRRRLYPLSNNDLSVLETQAKGDLAAFRQRHGIRELVLSKDAVGWKGCGKGTPACPFNLYVNRLGLNTAPCCRDHMKDLSHYVAACLVEMGVVHWLEGGSLLGAVRESGRLLDWEDDIDLSVLLDDDMTWERLAAGFAERSARDGYYVDLFDKKGFVSISFNPPKRWPFRWERNRLRGEIRADIIIYRRAISYGETVLERRSHKGAMPATESGGYGVPLEIVLPTSTVPFLGGEIACPNQSEAYLRMLYGDYSKVDYIYVDSGPANARARIDIIGDPPVQ
ncbi:MAG: LicD family protein [Alphaproteobacteria bacterium]|nr:LicD family protein [Alphaproteobacteria bacterium]